MFRKIHHAIRTHASKNQKRIGQKCVGDPLGLENIRFDKLITNKVLVHTYVVLVVIWLEKNIVESNI